MSPPHSVSAVLPAFNNADTIAEALESVAAQTVPACEVIVVDDGSSDDTATVAGACIARLRLPGRVLRQENAGPAAARNRGVEAARGDWIAFLDADDMWFGWRLGLQMEMASRHAEIGCWCGQSVRWTERDSTGEPARPSGNCRFREITTDDLLVNNEVATSTVLVSRKRLDEAGGFDPSFRGPEDFDLWLRLAAVARIAMVEAPLARYRVRPGSLSLDDRTFLPQVMRVLDKAFGTGGVLSGGKCDRRLAESTQCWNASWMAFQRGDRRMALRLLWRARRQNRAAAGPVRRPWWRLAARYAIGKIS